MIQAASGACPRAGSRGREWERERLRSAARRASLRRSRRSTLDLTIGAKTAVRVGRVGEPPGRLLSSLTHRLAQVLVVEQVAHGARPEQRIQRWQHAPGHAILDDLWRPSAIGHEHRGARSHRLHHHGAEGFLPGGKQQQIEIAHDRRDIATVAHEVHGAGEPQLLHPQAQLALIGGVVVAHGSANEGNGPDEHELCFGITTADPDHGFDGHDLTLPWRDLRDLP